MNVTLIFSSNDEQACKKPADAMQKLKIQNETEKENRNTNKWYIMYFTYKSKN